VKKKHQIAELKAVGLWPFGGSITKGSGSVKGDLDLALKLPDGSVIGGEVKQTDDPKKHPGPSLREWKKTEEQARNHQCIPLFIRETFDGKMYVTMKYDDLVWMLTNVSGNSVSKPE